jgi:hypothetical protein
MLPPGVDPMDSSFGAPQAMTGDWTAVSGGLLGIAVCGSLVATFIANPTLWEPEHRWKFLALWIAIGTLGVVVIVILVFLLT